MKPEFSVLIVCLNPGEKLKKTLESIGKQTYRNYEIIIKDGLSTDGSIAIVRKSLRISAEEDAVPSGIVSYDTEEEGVGYFPALRIIEKKDGGIYDAMNQAVREAEGNYIYFLNCGDVFYHENVLADVHKLIADNAFRTGIYYGNIYERMTGQVVASNPRLDAFGCYRNVPCHQACFYDRRLLIAHPFNTEYRVRADYEQFLWCFFTKDMDEEVSFVYGDILIADYEGGGFSETEKNRKISDREHREIVRKYMPAGKVWIYRMMMWITLAPLRTWIARNPVTSGFYNKLKKLYYGKGVR